MNVLLLGSCPRAPPGVSVRTDLTHPSALAGRNPAGKNGRISETAAAHSVEGRQDLVCFLCVNT